MSLIEVPPYQREISHFGIAAVHVCYCWQRILSIARDLLAIPAGIVKWYRKIAVTDMRSCNSEVACFCAPSREKFKAWSFILVFFFAIKQLWSIHSQVINLTIGCRLGAPCTGFCFFSKKVHRSLINLATHKTQHLFFEQQLGGDSDKSRPDS